MDKDFAPYQPSLDMKELGFDEPCFGYYVDGELRGINLGVEELGGVEPYYQRFGFHTLSNHDIDNPNKIVVTAPTCQQAFRWFRKKGYHAKVQREVGDLYFGYMLIISSTGTSWVIASTSTSSYEEAELGCLQKLIERYKLEERSF